MNDTIDPQEVVESYQRHDLKAIKGRTFDVQDGKVRCCGLTARYLGQEIDGGKISQKSLIHCEIDYIYDLVTDRIDSDYGMEYRYGFVNGFDNHPQAGLDRGLTDSKRYQEGYRCGLESNRLCSEAGLFD